MTMFQVVPSVHGIYFKDLKQTLRKEQCDVRVNRGIYYDNIIIN